MSSEGYDFDRLREFYADSPRDNLYGDTLGALHVSTATYGRLKAAGIETVTAVRERLDAGTLGDVPGIGPTRVAAITEAVAFYDERQLPADDPQLKRVGALYGLVAGMEQMIAAAQLLDDTEFNDALAAFHVGDWLPKAKALLDVEEGAAATARKEARYYLNDAVARVKRQKTLAPSTPTATMED